MPVSTPAVSTACRRRDRAGGVDDRAEWAPSVPTTTVKATTPVATVSVTTPSSSPVVTTTAGGGSATVPARPGTPASGPTGAVRDRESGTTSVASQGSVAGLGSPPARAVDGLSTGSGSSVSGAGAAFIPVVASRAGRPAVFLSRLRLERLPGPRSAVGLRLVLSRPARVRFLVIGPAPSCQVAGRFVLAGHRGLNKVAFRGRVRGRRLEPGIYTIVPQPAAGSRRLPKAVAVAIDGEGSARPLQCAGGTATRPPRGRFLRRHEGPPGPGAPHLRPRCG